MNQKNNEKVLYLDIGNTLTKFFGYKNNKIILLFKTCSIRKNLKNLLNTKLNYNFNKIIFSSVKISLNDLIYQFGKLRNIEVLDVKEDGLLRKYFSALEIKNVGSDILVNIFAIKNIYYQKNAILIQLGTANVITLIIDGKISGCIIFPGIEISKNALFNSVELIKRFDLKYEKTLFIGNNTVSAINIGILNSLNYLITFWILKIQNKYNNIDFKIYITGGYVKKLNFNNNNKFNYIIDEFLLIKGLKLLFNLN